MREERVDMVKILESKDSGYIFSGPLVEEKTKKVKEGVILVDNHRTRALALLHCCARSIQGCRCSIDAYVFYRFFYIIRGYNDC